VGSSIFYNDIGFREEGSTTTMTVDHETAQKIIERVDPEDRAEDGV
jgi:hypothetical protein